MPPMLRRHPSSHHLRIPNARRFCWRKLVLRKRVETPSSGRSFYIRYTDLGARQLARALAYFGRFSSSSMTT
jgi:hypothetical protein